MREFAVRHYECGECGFTAKHMTWEFPFLPGSLALFPYDRDTNDQSLEVDGVKFYWENGELIVEAPGEGKWALCSIHPVTTEAKAFYWICRPFAVEAADPCDKDFMEEIST